VARKFLTNVDLGLNELLNAVVQNLASDPSGGGLVEGLIWFNTTTKQYKYYDGTTVQVIPTAGGSVTSASVASANGFAGTVATPTTTPAITLETTVTGLLKGNGTGVSAAASGTDYAPATSGSAVLKGNGSGGFSSAVANTDYLPVSSPAMTGTPTAPTASSSDDSATIATTAFVQTIAGNLAQGIQYKPTATVVATSALPSGTYSNGSSGVGATFTVTATGTTTVDGHVLAANDLVLLTAQASAFQNGLYTVTTAGTTGVSTVLTRQTDMDVAASFAGAFVPVGSTGSSYPNSLWLANPSGTVTVGTTSIPFTQLNGATDITAGTGLAKSGDTLSLATLTGKYSATIGDGSSTSIAVTHNLGTQAVVVQVYDASTYVQYECDVTRTSASVVTLGFTTAPAANSLIAVVIG
jgi:hypothetical protein